MMPKSLGTTPGSRSRAAGGIAPPARGLTLVELLITVTIAVVVMGSIYALYRQGTTAFRAENQIADAQAQLRFAIDNLERDIQRAGFHATANSFTDQLNARICWMPADTRLYGLSIERGSGDVASPEANVNVSPSAISLFGDFFAPRGHVFQTLSIDATSRQVQLAQDPVLQSLSKEQFDAMFRGGSRWVRIVNDDGVEWYAPLESAIFESQTLILAGTPGAGVCQTGQGDYQDISPVGWIRYRVTTDTESAALFGDGSEARLAGKTNLVREELDIEGLPIAGTQLVVSEYVVDMQFYDFVFEKTPPGVLIPDWEVINFVDGVVDDGSTTGLLSAQGLGATPEQLRFLTVKLSVRTPEEDPDLPFRAREGVFAPLRNWDVAPLVAGSARVVSGAKRVELRNFAIRKG
jgi:Tfp pilus assembly protein PilE